MPALAIGIVTCSDTRTADEDSSGAALVEMADAVGCDVVLTTGGTGVGPRDVAPEATLKTCDREVPGIADAIRAGSLAITSRAMLSRGVAAQRGRTLVINLPGSEKGARESFSIVADVLEHAVEMMAGGGH